jgi:uncharacterized protein (DUF433 family)
MAARIIDRGRGPVVEGTRVTVYRIMDFVREGSSVERIATELHLTEEQVYVALDYIASHRRTVEAEYERILQRVQQRNPPQIDAGRATSSEALKQRIRAHCAQDGIHADSGRQ